MTLDALIMLVGGFIVLEPQLGIPATWDTILLSIAGVFVVALGIAVRRRGSMRNSSTQTTTSAQQ